MYEVFFDVKLWCVVAEITGASNLTPRAAN